MLYLPFLLFAFEATVQDVQPDTSAAGELEAEISAEQLDELSSTIAVDSASSALIEVKTVDGKTRLLDLSSALANPTAFNDATKVLTLRLPTVGDDQKTNNPRLVFGVSNRSRQRADCILSPQSCTDSEVPSGQVSPESDLAKEVAKLRQTLEKICNNNRELCE